MLLVITAILSVALAYCNIKWFSNHKTTTVEAMCVGSDVPFPNEVTKAMEFNSWVLDAEDTKFPTWNYKYKEAEYTVTGWQINLERNPLMGDVYRLRVYKNYPEKLAHIYYPKHVFYTNWLVIAVLMTVGIVATVF